MKGTLYSADFIKDSNGNLLLNEFNTDTDFTINALATFNYEPFVELLVSESINEVHVIYKGFQGEFVKSISSSLFNSTYTGSFTTTMESVNTIYPTDVDDAADKFILRMAYNESAIFDSTYCKTNTNLYKLFTDNNDSASVPNHYISSSEHEYQYDNLTHTFNESLVPDLVWKAGSLSTETTSLKMFKIGSSSLSDDERYSQFINELYVDGDCITNYVDTSNGTNYMSAIRTCNIIYGTELNNMILGSYEVDAIFEKPTVSIGYDENTLVNTIDTKHYFEFTTNYFKYDWRTLGGIFQDTLVQKEDGTFVSASQVVPDEKYISLHISGSPSNDLIENVLDWSSEGSTLPMGSYLTSSVLISSASHDIVYNIIPQIVLSGSDADFFLGPNMLTLVHDKEFNEIRYKRVYDIDKNIDVMLGASGSLIDIEEINMVVLDGDYKTYEFDVEDDDTFIMNDVGVKIIGHNINYAGKEIITCFLAGTMISMADGSEKAIEEVVVGDMVRSYDLTSDTFVTKEVTEIDHRHTVGDHKSSCEKLGDTCGVYNIGGSNVHFTPEHPFLLESGKWASLDQLTNQEPWKSEQTELITLRSGDVVLTKDGSFSIGNISFKEYPADTTVYNLTIQDTHTYIADGFIVHNK